MTISRVPTPGAPSKLRLGGIPRLVLNSSSGLRRVPRLVSKLVVRPGATLCFKTRRGALRSEAETAPIVRAKRGRDSSHRPSGARPGLPLAHRFSGGSQLKRYFQPERSEASIAKTPQRPGSKRVERDAADYPIASRLTPFQFAV
jgi:hypothetical protein